MIIVLNNHFNFKVMNLFQQITEEYKDNGINYFNII